MEQQGLGDCLVREVSQDHLDEMERLDHRDLLVLMGSLALRALLVPLVP